MTWCWLRRAHRCRSGQHFARVPEPRRPSRSGRPPGARAGRARRYRRPGDAGRARPPGFETDLAGLAAAEIAGLVRLGPGTVEFRHPLVRSAVYADAPAGQRRAAHRALAAALPDRDVDRRAWRLAAAASGTRIEPASAASRRRPPAAAVAARTRPRAAAFERAGRLASDGQVRARLLWQAAETGWLAGLTGGAVTLLDEARALASDPALGSRSTGWPATSRRCAAR